MQGFIIVYKCMWLSKQNWESAAILYPRGGGNMGNLSFLINSMVNVAVDNIKPSIGLKFIDFKGMYNLREDCKGWQPYYDHQNMSKEDSFKMVVILVVVVVNVILLIAMCKRMRVSVLTWFDKPLVALE